VILFRSGVIIFRSKWCKDELFFSVELLVKALPLHVGSAYAKPVCTNSEHFFIAGKGRKLHAWFLI